MRSEAIHDLLGKLDELESSSLNEEHKEEFRRLIYQVGAAHGIGKIEREERIRTARAMLDAGVDRAAIRDRMMARFQIRESQAYRDISSALAIVPKMPVLWDSKTIK